MKTAIIRTHKEIAAEITALRKTKPQIPARGRHGEDNRGAVDAQLTVLADHLSEDAIAKRYGHDDYLHTNALDALLWLTGRDEETLSAGWSVIARPAKARAA